ncbi:trimeric intracellular cation channel family protein [Silvanigrella aquatica]|uniref:Glycine transporter domain-containing protein n=1 Tax=Silvanigrella aquatica TaxID=1915309 RepID=A0A1L4CZE6_9BACT|nr:trimeric intracellular cation channel family protein [Silvanigrella aquatica]APJ03322.1 hypothetical protein AXG55_05150 [Silvanigrella aquatica]
MFLSILDYCGSFAFCLSGATIAASRRMDIFGVFVMSVIAGFGGGVSRDIIIGKTPPTIFHTPAYWVIALLTTFLVFAVKKQNRFLEKGVILFDSLGLAFFTLVGIKTAEDYGLLNYQCIMMGVITASFGGIMRDVIVNRVPYIFQKEIYAGFAVIGGLFYYFIKDFLPPFMLPYITETIQEIIVILFIFIARMISVWKNWHLPRPCDVTVNGNKIKITRPKN